MQISLTRCKRLRTWSALVLDTFAIGCDPTGLIEHDKMAAVESGAWTIGEYKLCQSYAENPDDEPVLTCSDSYKGNELKRFKVGFYGPTYTPSQSAIYVGQADKPAQKTFSWDCRKNNSDDVVISCWLKTDKLDTRSANLPGASQRLLDSISPSVDWTESEEPPGRIPGGGGCSNGYRIMHHLSGPGGYLRHEDCVPLK